MSIEKLFSKRRQVRAAWDLKRLPSKETIKDLLERTLKISPSKQNLFPFKIHAYGPHDLEKKKVISQICALYKTGSVNHMDSENRNGMIKTRSSKEINIYDYVLDEEGNDMRISPWVLVFEQRLCKANNFVKEYSKLHNITNETRFTQIDPKRYRGVANSKLASVEIGMFIKCLAGLCLENDLAISYIKSFPEWAWDSKITQYRKDVNKVGLSWDSLPEITEAPIMVVQIGHVADVDDIFASNSVDPNGKHWENKPSIDDVVRFEK
jgi:hypothetical protein